jgi:hypothetical protein
MKIGGVAVALAVAVGVHCRRRWSGGTRRDPGRRKDSGAIDVLRGHGTQIEKPHHLHEGGNVMSTSLMKRTALMFAVVGAALAVPATAAAVEPTRQTVNFTTIAPRPCPSGLTLIGIFNATHEITTFYDNDGAAVRELTVLSFEVTTTNPLTGQSLPGRGVRVFHHDLVTGEFFTTGDNAVTSCPTGALRSAAPGGSSLTRKGG